MSRHTLQLVSGKSNLDNFIVWNTHRLEYLTYLTCNSGKKTDGSQFDVWTIITNCQYRRSFYVRTISYFRQSIAELHNVDILMYCVSLRIDMYSKCGVSVKVVHEAWEIPSSETMKSGRLYLECPEHLWSRESRVCVWEKKSPLDFSGLSCRRSSQLNSQHNEVTLSQCRLTTGRSEACRRSLMYVCYTRTQ